MRIINFIGWLLANICGAFIYTPLIIIFIVIALSEIVATGKCAEANRVSKELGKSIEVPLWKIRTFNGFVPFEKPDGMK